MTWTRSMRRGAGFTSLGTLAMIAVSIWYLSARPEAAEISLWDFTKMSAVVVAVWSAIGITMGIFIVMILKKNENRAPGS